MHPYTPAVQYCNFLALCVWLACRYLSYLGFQLHTHHDLFKGDDGDEEPIMSFAGAILVLTGITVLVAVCSE